MNETSQREEALFEAALELPPAQRGNFLKQACGEDAQLHWRLEELLRGHQRTDGVLDQSTAVAMRGSPPLTEKSGDRIGRYRLLQQIGEGGCGVVYMAEQEEPVRRRVALKVIKLGMDTKSVIVRFEAERQALALMDHPNIAKVLDAGATATGRPFFVMELVRGIKITDYCDQNQLATGERLQLFTQVCRAIQHAHQKGIIHRDIKPSNILVTLHDGVPVPKVIDFGIAKATTNQRLTDKTLFTAFEQFIGTPAYMSPEQAEMSGLDVDTRSDIYALGVLLYELLTGKTPFDAKELLHAGLDEMRRTIREKEPVRPSTRLSTLQAADLTTTAQHRHADAPELVHLLRGDLDWIVMKCLEKDRTRRYETANGLAMDIRRHLALEPIIARPPSTAYRFQKFARRNKLALATVSAVAMAVLLGVGGVFWQWRRAEGLALSEARQRRVVEVQSAELRLNLYASDISLSAQAVQRGNFGRARRVLAAMQPKAGEADLRGFEWRYLWNLCQGDQLATLTGHDWIVSCATFSPDGKWIASGSQDRTVKIWDATHRELIATLHAATGAVWSVAFTPDGRHLITSGYGGTKLWETATWQLTKNFPGQVSAVSPTGSLLAVSESSPTDWLNPGGGVSLWDYRRGEKLREWARPAGALAFSPEGKQLALAGIHRNIDFYDVASGERRRTIATSNLVWSIAFSPDGNRLVTTAGARDPVVYDLADRQPPRKLKGHLLTVWSARFSPDGKTIVTTGSDQTIRLWDAGTGEAKQVLHGHDSEVWSATFSPDGRRIVSGGKDQAVMLWSGTTRTRTDSFPHRNEMEPIFSPDGARLVTARRTTEKLASALWNIRDGNFITEIPGRPAIGFSPDGKQLIHWGARGQNLERWSPEDRSATTVALEGLAAGEAVWTHEGFSPEWKVFFTVDQMGTVRFWDAGNGKAAGDFRAPTPIQSVALSPDGSYFALGVEHEAVVRLYERRTGRERQLTGHRDAVNGLAFSPDGVTLASCSLDGTIRLWDTATGKPTATMSGNLEDAADVTFAPDGRTLASIHQRHAIKFWHAATGRDLLVLDFSHAGNSLRFSPDGRYLAATTDDGDVHLFEAPPLTPTPSVSAR